MAQLSNLVRAVMALVLALLICALGVAIGSVVVVGTIKFITLLITGGFQ